MRFGEYQAVDMEDIGTRRKAEEQLRNQKAQTEAQKAALLKKQRQILECQEQIRRMDRYAERSLMDGQEEKAYLYLERKQEWQSRLVELLEEAGITVKNAPIETERNPEQECRDESQDDAHQVQGQ